MRRMRGVLNIMEKHKNNNLTKFSQELRRQMTKEERHLWYDFLKNCGETFNRQKVFDCYIADFYCAKCNMIIELDGGGHFETKAQENDKIRDKFFEKKGILVLRYTNYQINNNFDGVCEDILEHMK